jgi:hypothetical protein
MMPLLVALLCLSAHPHQASTFKFVVTAPSVHHFTGRVVVYLGDDTEEPRFGPDWFNPKPCYSAKFSDADGVAGFTIDNSNAVGFPGKLADLKPGEYTVQAVVDLNLGGRAIGDSPGNVYSEPQKIKLNPQTSGTIAISCKQVAHEIGLIETNRLKDFRVKSTLLSDWYHRPTYLKAGVVLPTEYLSDPHRKFPIVYEIPGFGGTYNEDADGSLDETEKDHQPFIVVVLDPNCPTGHCVFADSANNGPWGKALTTEMIPAIDKAFRTEGDPGARYLRGHSSGGWSSLWLQVEYPLVFGGVWSTSPDPVDFRDFQRIDLYEPGVNMFTDEHGKPRPLARIGTRPYLYYKAFSDMERPIRGEQLGSFEAVFSPRGKDGQPEKLWNRDTGDVDENVAEAWRKYDIDDKLKTEWYKIGPTLEGKLHVFVGDTDTFYLEGAVKLLKANLTKLGSDAEVQIRSGDHMTVLSNNLLNHIDKEMADKYRDWKNHSTQ